MLYTEINDSRYTVHQKYVFVLSDTPIIENGKSWSDEWEYLFTIAEQEVEMLVKDGKGVLDVNIKKTNPAQGVLFEIEITYWDKP